MYPGAFYRIPLIACYHVYFLAVTDCFFEVEYLYIFIRWFICSISLLSTLGVNSDAIVMNISKQFIPSLSLCFISVFICFPSSSNFYVPTFIGVIIGSSNSAHVANGS